MEETVNVEMSEAWNGLEGETWARHWHHYDQSVGHYHVLLMDAAGVQPRDHVLDIGCGTGEVTRAAARRAYCGAARGVDLSRPMLERARELAEREQLENVRFVQADAQVCRHLGAPFTLALSRFGAMFFTDERQAMSNVREALGPGGRLVLVAWRGLSANEWLTAIFDALDPGRHVPRPRDGTVGPLGLADPAHARAVLEQAGFSGVELQAVDAPFWAGQDADRASRWLEETSVVRRLSASLEGARRRRALDRLRGTLAEHEQSDGVLFGSGAWLITARVEEAGR